MNFNIQNLPAWVEPKSGYASLAFQLQEYLLITFMGFFPLHGKQTLISLSTQKISSAQTK